MDAIDTDLGQPWNPVRIRKQCQKELNNYEKRECNDCAADLNPGRDVDGVGCGPGRGERRPA